MTGKMRAVAAALLLLTAGCGDGEVVPGGETDVPGQPAPADQTNPTDQPLPADDGDLRSVQATLTEWDITLSPESVAAGAIAFDVRNSGSVVHRFEVEGNGEEWVSEDINPGNQITMSLNLTPGVYEVYCPIVEDGVNHEERGMRTTLNVQ